MLSEEAPSTALKITYKGAEITSDIVNFLIKQYLERSQKQFYGKQSLKKLNRKGKELENISVSKADLKGLQNELKKYGVDFAVHRNKADSTYEIWFKGNDVKQIQTALKNYMSKSFNKDKEKPSIKEIIAAAKEKIKEIVKDTRQREKTIDRGRDR